jgi:hypothetical protein
MNIIYILDKIVDISGSVFTIVVYIIIIIEVRSYSSPGWPRIVTLLTRFPECWDYICLTPCLAVVYIFNLLLFILFLIFVVLLKFVSSFFILLLICKLRLYFYSLSGYSFLLHIHTYIHSLGFFLF